MRVSPIGQRAQDQRAVGDGFVARNLRPCPSGAATGALSGVGVVAGSACIVQAFQKTFDRPEATVANDAPSNTTLSSWEASNLVKADLGTKRVCPSCGARFYDLTKRPIECPKCAFSFEPEALYKQRRPRQPEPAAAQPVAAGCRGRGGRRTRDDGEPRTKRKIVEAVVTRRR